MINSRFSEFLSTRSKLYNLQPIGIGISDVESLVSYIARLAFEHNIFPVTLYNHVIMPHMLEEMKVEHSLKLGKIKNVQRINGSSILTESVTTAVSHLTQINKVSNLTFSQLSDLFYYLGVLKNTKNWCPSCYKDMNNNNLIVYDKLIWSFQEVKLCLIHNRELISKCPNCDSKINPLSQVYALDYCSKCHSWLGEMEPQATTMSKKDIEWERWVQKNLGKVIVKNYNYSNNKIFIENIIKIREVCNRLNFDRLENYIGISDSTISQYTTGKRNPKINVALRLSFCTRTSLHILLTSPIDDHIQLRYCSLNKQKHNFNTKKYEIKRELIRILNNNLYYPISHIEKKFSVSYLTLEKYFPKLIKEIKEKNVQLSKQILEKKLNDKVKIVKETTFNLHREGIYPSSKKVEQRVGFKFRNFKDNDVFYNAWMDAKKELDLNKLAKK